MPINKPIRVLLVGNHALVRSGLRMLIENQPGMTVAGEASNCRDAISTREQADIVLLDLDFNDGVSLAFLPELRSATGEVPILILTSQHDRETQLRAIRLGAMGVVFKE